MTNQKKLLVILLSVALRSGESFSITRGCTVNQLLNSRTKLRSEPNLNGEDSLLKTSIADELKNDQDTKEKAAATNTINARLMAELDAASGKEKYGARSGVGKKLRLSGFRSEKTDEEREAALEEARDLNGVNPVVAIVGALSALTMAGALWYFTQWLGEFFVMHPFDTDIYFAQRVTQVVRNVAMGLASLASGFFGVTGLGILLLGLRVAYGVAKGELDPTPIKKSKNDEIELPNVWDLMMNKKPSRRGNKNDDNPFGI